ncbi:hypothetical protein FRX31_008022, partial [Thalictrum thalictroides]
MLQDGSQPIEDGSQPVEDDFQPSGEEQCTPVPRGERKQIKFNDDGQPIGFGSAQFATLIGKATTTHFSPTYSDWPSVPDNPVKMKIWDVVLERESPDGKVTRTQLFVALHSRKDGTYPSLEMRPTMYVSLMGGVEFEVEGNGISKTVVHASAPFEIIAQQEKRARESSEMNFRIVMQRLDEETKARKVLEEKLASVLRESSENDNGCR